MSFSVLMRAGGAVEVEVGGERLDVERVAGVRSALDESSIAESREVGSATARVRRRVTGQRCVSDRARLISCSIPKPIAYSLRSATRPDASSTPKMQQTGPCRPSLGSARVTAVSRPADRPIRAAWCRRPYEIRAARPERPATASTSAVSRSGPSFAAAAGRCVRRAGS